MASQILRKRLGDRADEELHFPVCVICGTQTTYPAAEIQMESDDADYTCVMCSDPRQFIGPYGQKWTTLARLHDQKKYNNVFEEVISDQLWTIRTEPQLGIGQRAYLMKNMDSGALIMWDCVAYIDDSTIQKINELSGGKGLQAIAVSHPHFYTTTATWAQAFPGVELWCSYIDFFEWHQRKDLVDSCRADTGKSDQAIFSSGSVRLIGKQPAPIGGARLYMLGGHFPGSMVLLWENCLFTGDTLMVPMSGRYKSAEPQRDGIVSFAFMWSFPNHIPLTHNEVRRVCSPLAGADFDKAFDAFGGIIWGHASSKLQQTLDILERRADEQKL